MRRIAMVIHNVRSALNVGSMLRTAEGFGVNEVYITGYSPYPEAENDARLPHQRRKIARQIHKTALGAECFVSWKFEPDIRKCINSLKDDNYQIIALEQSPGAVELDKFLPKDDIALIVGNEITGLERKVLKLVDSTVQIPMSGRKESFNVATAAGIALYQLSYAGARQK